LSIEPRRSGEASGVERLRNLWRRQGSFILIGSVLAGTLLLATFRWPGDLRISGRLVASSVTMVLDDGLQIEPDIDFDKGEVRLSGLRSVQPPAEIATERIEAKSATFSAKHITLSAIHLGDRAELTLDAAQRASAWLQTAGAEGSLEFEADGPLSIAVGNDKPLATEATPNPLAMSAQSDGSIARPLSVAGVVSRGLSFQDLPKAPAVSLIRFGRRASTTDFGATFVSTVDSGAIQLVDIDREVKLDRGAWVMIDGLHGHIFELEPSESGYSVGFSGVARRIAIGPAGFAEDLTPTSLEYLYHQQWLQLLWAGTLAGFAILAKVQSWLAGKLD
jgi:hypothetical protein